MHRSRASALIACVAVLGALFAGANLYAHGVSGDGIEQDDTVIFAEHFPSAVPNSESGPLFGVQFS